MTYTEHQNLLSVIVVDLLFKPHVSGAAEYSMHSNFGPQYNPQNSNQNNVEPPRMSEMTSFHSPVTLNNQFGAPNHLQQHTTVRLFSTSMLNRAESFISRGQCAHLSSFHANEANSVKFINPIEVSSKWCSHGLNSLVF